MQILDFQKPDEVVMINDEANVGSFEFRPLEPGYGLTVGNAVRRVLLSSLEGYAITSIKIKGVDHEFSTIKGVVQDVTEIILNLKQIRFKQQEINLLCLLLGYKFQSTCYYLNLQHILRRINQPSEQNMTHHQLLLMGRN